MLFTLLRTSEDRETYYYKWRHRRSRAESNGWTHGLCICKSVLGLKKIFNAIKYQEERQFFL